MDNTTAVVLAIPTTANQILATAVSEYGPPFDRKGLLHDMFTDDGDGDDSLVTCRGCMFDGSDKTYPLCQGKSDMIVSLI